jgi:hypothetical protein
VQRTCMSREMLERALSSGHFPQKVENGWRREDVVTCSPSSVHGLWDSVTVLVRPPILVHYERQD